MKQTLGLWAGLAVLLTAFPVSAEDKRPGAGPPSEQPASTLLEPAPPPSALADAVVLIIRHAEKPAQGRDLSAAGRRRAEAYVSYFEHFTIDGLPLKLDYLVATADSAGSDRPRQTLEPLSRALGLKINAPFASKQCGKLAEDLQSNSHGKLILIAWHHGQIPALLTALGSDPRQLLPDGKWPEDEFSWVIQLRYDHQGRLIPTQARRINEGLMPGDAK
ncbi:conserved exported hypothetical protein [Verrucomicrobia bacterium]|nr:conserved exported hypothetical protein [Verrucomicrobiota bacterium]